MINRILLRYARERYTPAENVAINLMVQSPDSTVDELVSQVKGFDMDLYDEVTGTEVKSADVLAALDKYAPKPIHGSDTRVYHATDAATAKTLMRRGLVPETKPRPRSDDFEYAPGRGIDVGLYIGASPRDVSSYGHVILEVVVPKKFLEVPTEQAQLGVTDPMQALRQHDGAIINHRLPPDAFRIVPEDLVMKTASVEINWPSPGHAFNWDDNDSLADTLLDDNMALTPNDLPSIVLARYLRIVETANRVASRFAKYKEIKVVPKASGKGTTEVRVYSPRQIALRKSKKSKRLQKLSGNIDKMVAKVKKDLTSSDKKVARVALAICLINETFERVGNETSAKGENSDTDSTPHLGVTGWAKQNITFKGSKATIKYRGKSSVDHVKIVEDPAIVKALKKAVDECSSDEDCVFHWDDGKITAKDVNDELKSFGDLTAKDLRGWHANRLMKEELKKVRKGTLPEDKKEREKQLKDEWKKALETTAKEIQHEPGTLQGQYLVDSMKESYLQDGTIIDRLDS